MFGVCGVTVLSSVLNGSGGLEGGRGLAHSPGGSYCLGGGDTTPLEKAISSPGPPSPNILTVWLAGGASLYSMYDWWVVRGIASDELLRLC